MNKRQKEILQNELKNEKTVLNQIDAVYQRALIDIEKKIDKMQARIDKDMTDTAAIYQKRYQEALKKQISAILDMMNANQYEKIQDYLEQCYKDAFVGNMYDLHGQGIPVITPINQENVAKAIQHNTKLSKPLYEALGYNVEQLKKTIAGEISRGIATGMMYSEIARNIRNHAQVSNSKAMTIARTEGHRIQEEARNESRHKAKESGADIVKQWDSTLDKKTRPTHQKLDGQIRELDEPFEVNGMKAMYPSGFGKAKEDINCRCVCLQRARWALDEDELKTLKERAEAFGLDKSDTLNDFKKKYLKSVEKLEESAKIKANTNIKELKDFNEMEKYFDSKYKISIDKSVFELDFENVKSSLYGVETMFEDFPELKEKLKKVTTSKSGVMACGLDGNITFNPVYFNKGYDLEKIFKKQIKMGFWVKNATPESTGFHEAAHAVEGILIDLNKSYEYEFQKIFAWNKCEEAKRIVSQACKNIKKTTYGKGKKNAELIGSISRYAQKDQSETMAEAFADIFANGENASPLSLEIKRLTIETYKKYKGE